MRDRGAWRTDEPSGRGAGELYSVGIWDRGSGIGRNQRAARRLLIADPRSPIPTQSAAIRHASRHIAVLRVAVQAGRRELVRGLQHDVVVLRLARLIDAHA